MLLGIGLPIYYRKTDNLPSGAIRTDEQGKGEKCVLYYYEGLLNSP